MPKKNKKGDDKFKEETEPLTEKKYENVEKPTKIISINEIFLRFFHSLIPIDSKLKLSLINSPDLVGPIFIATLLAAFIFNLCKKYRILCQDDKTNNIVIFIYISLIIYFYIFGFTFLLYICFKNFRNKLKYKYLVNVFGYSLSIFIPILLFHLIFSNLTFMNFVILFGYGIYSSIIFLIFNFSDIDVNSAIKYLISSFCNMILIILIAFILYKLCCVFDKLQSRNISLISNQKNIVNVNNSIINGTKNNMIDKTPNIINNHKLTINLALSADFNYVYPTLVFITSLMENIGPKTFYQIYLMTPNEDKKNDMSNILNTLITKYGNDKLNITYLLIDSSQIPEDVAVNKHITKETYFRLILPSLLPNLDRILYMDTDIINLKDLSELYSLDLEDDIYLRCVPTNKKFLKQLEEFGITSKYYFNAGVILMNLKSFRKYGIEKKLIDLISTHKLKQHDQTALNIICNKNNKLMHPKFNFAAFSSNKEFDDYKAPLVEFYTEEELYEAYNHPVNFHYSSVFGAKPWNKKYVPKKHYWWYFANKTDFMDKIMDYTNFDQKDIKNLFKILQKSHGYIDNYHGDKNKINI